jgi:1-deoxy-D-xylulose-5-phosphate reductoisomerase
MKKIAILGSTGSIGTSLINIIKKDKKNFKIELLTANKNYKKILKQAKNFNVKNVVIINKESFLIAKKITKKNKINIYNDFNSFNKKISIDSATMMNKVFEVIEAKKIFNLKYNQLEILLHPDSYLHAIVKFRNGLTKILAHDTSMTIPIFNSIYLKNEKNIRSQPLNIKMLNDLKLKFLNPKIFPSIRLLNLLKNKDSLFETVIVSANDTLVNLFLKKHIKFTDISKILLKIVKHHDLDKYHDIKVINIAQIVKLNKYVSLKVKAFCV